MKILETVMKEEITASAFVAVSVRGFPSQILSLMTGDAVEE